MLSRADRKRTGCNTLFALTATQGEGIHAWKYHIERNRVVLIDIYRERPFGEAAFQEMGGRCLILNDQHFHWVESTCESPVPRANRSEKPRM